MRIISLLPSATEIVCAVGAENDLVGVSHECDWPVGVSSLPVVTQSLTLGTDSASIDQSIRSAAQRAISIYQVDGDLISRLKPDVVITQDLCEVCAVPAAAVEQALRETVNGRPPELLRLAPRSLSDVFNDIERIGAATGRKSEAQRLKIEHSDRLRSLVLNSPARPMTVLSLEWLNPVMLGGLWTPELIDLAGGVSLLAAAGQPAPSIEVSRLQDIDPELVLIKPCGYRLADSEAEIARVQSIISPQWSATINNRVFVVDGNQYFNRSGPRLVDSAELLHGLISGRRDADWYSRFSTDVMQLKDLQTEASFSRLDATAQN